MAKTTTVVILTLGLIAFAVMRAQRSADAAVATPMLTALDYIEIQQLAARYAQAIDSCSNNGYDYADLFTPDGFFASSQDGQIGGKAQGRDALAAVSGGGVRGCKDVAWIQLGVHHVYVNHIITPSSEGASGRVDLLAIGLEGNPNKIERQGYYEDAYVKQANGWHFKSRIHHVPAGFVRSKLPAPGVQVQPRRQ